MLVIEDNPEQWWLIQKALESCLPGVEPVWFSNQHTTKAYLEECAVRGRYPHLILLDLYLPDREVGLAMLQRIRQGSSALRKVPILVLSHSNRMEDITEAYTLGANAYMVKPLNEQEWSAHFQTVTEYWSQ
ncbi:response regulator [Larkinella soli]|uniref:response regulator n=1 Tax=Larkinella soli TaxID=1770527 RepID=UPI0013E3FBE8|nr:response regulator [Larkinella soli]